MYDKLSIIQRQRYEMWACLVYIYKYQLNSVNLLLWLFFYFLTKPDNIYPNIRNSCNSL